MIYGDANEFLYSIWYFKLFTIYRGGTTSDTASVVGLAYVSEVCGANRFTIIEDLGGFAYIPVASHEIGHK